MLKGFKINHKALRNYDDRNNNLFLVLSLLHINGFINNDSINALFKSLRAGKLSRRVGTFYFKGTDQWYNDEDILEVYSDIFDNMSHPKNKKEILRLERINKLRKINGSEPKILKTHLSFEEVLKYLNLYLNRNRNYCIDHLFYEFIKPCVVGYEYEKMRLNEMFDYNFEHLENSHTNYSSYDDDYCCEYCCGDYSDWSRNRSEQRDIIMYKEVRKDISKLISDFLNTKRVKFKGSYKEYVVD